MPANPPRPGGGPETRNQEVSHIQFLKIILTSFPEHRFHHVVSDCCTKELYCRSFSQIHQCAKSSIKIQNTRLNLHVYLNSFYSFYIIFLSVSAHLCSFIATYGISLQVFLNTQTNLHILNIVSKIPPSCTFFSVPFNSKILY